MTSVFGAVCDFSLLSRKIAGELLMGTLAEI